MTERMTYANHSDALLQRYPEGVTPSGVAVEDIIQLKMQNTFATHLDIARAMAGVMRADMSAYDQDASRFTQSLGCWSGFHAQQMIKSVKRLRGTTKGAYVYLSGWRVCAIASATCRTSRCTRRPRWLI
jgi:isocitrate lyase